MRRTLDPGMTRAPLVEFLIVPAMIIGTTPIKSESCKHMVRNEKRAFTKRRRLDQPSVGLTIVINSVVLLVHAAVTAHAYL